MPVQQIGRFEVVRELGRGGQGSVYLANDPQLHRQVAIKTLRRSGAQANSLSGEALAVSRLNHPNIITLYDAGEYQGIQFLVYAYVEGSTLAQLLKVKKTVSFVQAAEIASGVLDGLACAHAQDIVHLDIKPANIMISQSNVPMVMDFGLARTASEQAGSSNMALNGTPRYVAPEVIAGNPGGVTADIYAVGTMLYEMVTGKFAVHGENLFEVLHRAANEQVAAPSSENERVDEQLESIILKSLSKNPTERYLSAQDMKQALLEYLGNKNAVVQPQAGDNSTLEFLLRRMRTKKDFPAISGSIAEIQRIVSSDSTSSSKLASTILQDPSLTTKLLKMVNAATYGHFGGTINTVSKAVVILGFETVRSIASSLILVEFLQNKPQAAQLKDEITGSIFSSIVAAQLAVGQNIRDAEEVMVCSMFYNLGRLLTTYYFFEESQEISRLVEQGEDEDKAAAKVLGLGYHELAEGVAKSWNFSSRMLAGMSKLKSVQESKDELDNMTVTVNLANDLYHIAKSSKAQNKSQHMNELVKRYAPAIKVTEKELSKALDTGLNEFVRRSTMLGLKLGKNPILDNVRAWNGKQSESSEAPANHGKDDLLKGEGRLDSTLVLSEESMENINRPANPEAVLGAGIQDVTNSLVNEFRLNDVLQMILETIYRGMGFNRAILLVRDNRTNLMAARYGFGPEVEKIIPRFKFSLDYVPDVFHLAVAKGLDIAIENTKAPNIVDKIPTWYWNHLNAPCFLLLPAVVKEKTICMFYADMTKVNGLNTSPQQLSLLRTLRNQAVLAIKQKV